MSAPEAAKGTSDGWRENLPPVRGEIKLDAPLAPLTWFRAGGPAEVLFSPRDEDDLAEFLKQLDGSVPVSVIGLGSNLLVRDGGVPGVVIKLGHGFNKVAAEAGDRIRAGTASVDVKVAKTALEAGLSGLSFFRGIPGTIGGALRMNAGAYGRETRDTLIEARAITRKGEVRVLDNAAMGYSYRHSEAPADLIFTEALFQAAPGEARVISAEMKEITRSREESQPVRSRTGGSTFKNPEGSKAWQLIDRAGCRGLRIGDAQVSEKHCNFLINEGDATGHDLETLGETVRRRVRETSGIELEWEIRRIGIEAET